MSELTKSMQEQSNDLEKEIKKHLSLHPEELSEIYNIEVPQNINKITKKEFLNYILSIQQKVYSSVQEMGYKTPFYYLVNRFLFVNYKPIEISFANNANMSV